MPNKNLLRSAIAKAGFTQTRLAKETGISKSALNARINGKSAFNTLQIDKICSVLDITDTREKADIFLSTTSQNRDT